MKCNYLILFFGDYIFEDFIILLKLIFNKNFFVNKL